MRKILITLLIIIGVGGAVYALGPSEPVDTTISFDPASLGEDLDASLKLAEEKIPNIRPYSTKEILWADPQTKAKTPYALIYLHGFSADKAETRPLTDNLAKSLGANAYFNRLKGHGRDGAAMGEAVANDWLNDVAEAIEIGSRIGDKIIIIGTSTGATLATWAATQQGYADNMAAVVLVSPNYGVTAPGSEIIRGPWGRQLLKILADETHSFEPDNEEHGKHWTTTYPSAALIPMMALVNYVRNQDIEEISTRALFVYSPKDQVVDVEQTAKIRERWGAPHDFIAVIDSKNAHQHVIVGDITSPETVKSITTGILEWIQKL